MEKKNNVYFFSKGDVINLMALVMVFAEIKDSIPSELSDNIIDAAEAFKSAILKEDATFVYCDGGA